VEAVHRQELFPAAPLNQVSPEHDIPGPGLPL